MEVYIVIKNLDIPYEACEDTIHGVYKDGKFAQGVAGALNRIASVDNTGLGTVEYRVETWDIIETEGVF